MQLALGFSLAVALVAAAPSEARGAHENSGTEVRLALARNYVSIADRHPFLTEAYERQVRSTWTFCVEKTCQRDLERAIHDTVNDLKNAYELKSARVFADHLSEDQLRAAIHFAESSAGRAIAEAQRAKTKEMAAFPDALVVEVYKGVSLRFCPNHKDICLGGSAMPGAGPTSPR